MDGVAEKNVQSKKKFLMVELSLIIKSHIVTKKQKKAARSGLSC